MFTLRSCFSEKKERNNFLGKNYDIFYKSEKKNNEFDPLFKELFPEPDEIDINEVMAIISNGEVMIPLYKSYTYYIMNDKGKTFSKICWK